MIKMKKLLAIVVLGLLWSGSAKAEWEFIENLDNGNKFFADVKSFKTDSNYSYMWTLTDLKKPYIHMNKEMRSYAEYNKIDCKLSRYGKLQYVFYEGQKGTGQPTPFQREEMKWLYPPPGSSGFNFIKAVCDNS